MFSTFTTLLFCPALLVLRRQRRHPPNDFPKARFKRTLPVLPCRPAGVFAVEAQFTRSRRDEIVRSLQRRQDNHLRVGAFWRNSGARRFRLRIVSPTSRDFLFLPSTKGRQRGRAWRVAEFPLRPITTWWRWHPELATHLSQRHA